MEGYIPYMLSECRMPRGWRESLLMTTLMVTTMATTMVLFMGLILGFTDSQLIFAYTHVLPVMVPFGIVMRTFVLRHPIKWLERNAIEPFLDGMARAAVTMAANILIMTTIMRASGMMLGSVLQGRYGELDALMDSFLFSQPIVYVVAFLWSFLFVSPLMRFVFGRLMSIGENMRSHAHGIRSKGLSHR